MPYVTIADLDGEGRNKMYAREPEWTTELVNRKPGATTFLTCGWCEYNGTGTFRYDCMLDGVCTLFPSYGKEREVQFDTPCRLMKLGKADIHRMIEAKGREITDHKNGIERAEKCIIALQGIDAESIPPLPDNRNYDHFNIDDDIMFFINVREGDGLQYLKHNVWLPAKVINGYRHHDGCTSFGTSEPWHTGDYLSGCGGSFGNAVPTILLKSEYEWFANHPEHWQDWIKTACDKSFNGNIIDWQKVTPPTSQGA